MPQKVRPTTPPPKIYAAVVFTPTNKQVEKIKKVYDEKIANLDKQLSQEVKQYQLEEKWMKYIITQLVNQKQETSSSFKTNSSYK
jgi:hypothetical protein